MEIREINDRMIFDMYVSRNPLCHYMKTSMWGEYQKNKGLSYQMLGLFEGEKMVGSALALRKRGIFPWVYIPKGMCLDGLEVPFVMEAYGLLRDYYTKQGVVFLRIDPNILRMEKDLKGNVVEGGENHEAITQSLIELGYEHKGYGYAYDGSWTNRYTLIVPLEKPIENTFKKFSSHRRLMIKKAEKMGLTTEEGTIDDIDDLLRLQKELSMIKGFKPFVKKDYLELMDAFGEHAVIYITRLHIDQSIVLLQGRKTKLAQEKESIAKTIERLQKCSETRGNDIALAAGFMFWFGEIAWCWQYYYDHDFDWLVPLDSFNYNAMKDMQGKGVNYYDLCGFGGITTGINDDPEFHLYEYKRGFAPRFIEHIGQFDFVFHRDKMKAYTLCNKVTKKISRNWHLLKYKKTDK